MLAYETVVIRNVAVRPTTVSYVVLLGICVLMTIMTFYKRTLKERCELNI